MLQLQRFTFNPFAENTYVLSDGAGACAMVDPGCLFADEEALLADYLKAEGLRPQRLLLTHAHIDHVFGNAWVHEQYGLVPELHPDDFILLDRLAQQAQMFGVDARPSPKPKPMTEVLIELGEVELEVRHAPGHAPGHVIFIDHASKQVVVGDVIFQGSIGRTDLPGGDLPTLMRAIYSQVLTLPDDYTLWPGHGPETTVGHERATNPFVREYAHLGQG